MEENRKLALPALTRLQHIAPSSVPSFHQEESLSAIGTRLSWRKQQVRSASGSECALESSMDVYLYSKANEWTSAELRLRRSSGSFLGERPLHQSPNPENSRKAPSSGA